MTDPALSHLDAPRDPRLDRDVPAFGALPTVAVLDPRTTRVLAPNPSPMTLDGTNTYVVGEPGSGEAVIVDPGPDDASHREHVTSVLDERDAQCVLVLVTHHHRDHAEAAQPWGEAFSCQVTASTPDVAGLGGRVVRDGDEIDVGSVRFHVIGTPGHSADHVAFRLDHGPLLTGDHILGRGTSVVAYPDGDLEAYLGSLRRVLELGPDSLFPGHGPEMGEDPSEIVRFYLAHRRFREEQILGLLEEGPAHTTALVRRIYDEVDERVLPAAAASTRAALEKLAGEGRVAVDGSGMARLAT